MSLMGLINDYDRKQSAYIAHLEEQLEIERSKNTELVNLLMTSTAANERKTLELILSGHYDQFVKKEEATSG